jgi:CHAT domain-containing protein
MPLKQIPRFFCALLLLLSLPAISLAQQQQGTAEELLATRIVKAQNAAEITTLLEEKKELKTPKLIRALVSEGDRIRNGGKFAEAIVIYERAQNLAESIGDQEGFALAIDRTGNVHFRQDNYEKALELHARSLAIRQQLGNKAAIAETLNNTGLVHEWQKKQESAMELYRKALALSESVGDKRGMGTTLNNLGNLLRSQGKYGLAEEHYRRGLRLMEEVGDQEGIATSLNSLGGLAYFLRDFLKAEEDFGRSLALYEQLGLTTRAGAVRNNLATANTELGNYELAIKLAGQSLAAAEASGSKVYAARALNALGNLYFYQGDTALSLAHYQRAHALYQEAKLKSSAAYILHNIAGVHARQGNYELAQEYYQRGMAIHVEVENRDGVAESLNRIGDVYELLGDYTHALESYEKSRAIAAELKDPQRIGMVLKGIGEVYRSQGELAKALDYFQRSLKIHEDLKVKRSIELILRSIADIYYRQGDYQRAIETTERAIALTEELGQLVGRNEAYTTMGQALVALGQGERAEKAFTSAIKIIEERRRFTAGGARDEERSFEGQVSPYREMVKLLVARNRLSEALSFAESAKARVLLDVLQQGRGVLNKSMTASEQAQERKLLNALASLNAQLTRMRQQQIPDARQVAGLEKQLQQARLDYEAFETSLYTAHPELKLRRGETRVIAPSQTAELLRDGRTALIEFVVTDKRTYLFVLTRSEPASQTAVDLKVYPVEIKRRELAARVESFRLALAERDPAFREPARQLYELLLAPASAQLRRRDRLVIVPDDALWELPFQALPSASNRYLLEESALSYAPSLSVLYEMGRQQGQEDKWMSGATLLAFGNPTFGEAAAERTKVALRGGARPEPLPDAEKEVKLLAEIYGHKQSRVYTGPEAREGRAKTEAGEFKILHFATHGVINNASPMYSHLLMSQGGEGGEDGLLEAWEIMRLELKADLVVLSACETARGRVGAGEGMIGLTWALFVAGSPATLVSQWKVDSLATKELMLDFHRNLRANISSPQARFAKAEALRQAALKMLRSSNYNHPFHWASFVLIGR